MNASKSGPNLFDAIAKNAQGATTTLVKQVNDITTDIVKSANTAVNAGVNAMNKGINAGVNAVNSVAKNIPVVNSMLPLNSNKNSTTTVANNSNKNVFTNITTNFANNVNSAANAIANNLGVNTNAGKPGLPGWAWVAIVFVLIASIIAGLMFFFKDQVAQAYMNIEASLKKALGITASPPPAPPTPAPSLSEEPAPADLSGAAGPGLLEQGAAVLRKILPSQKEVFNVNANDFTYYDAEPMCRAMGAELATYDQVKDAWSKGANWCNYGWVKGQNAIYPTQKEFYEKLQSGPPEDQTACGVPGVNGGYFDNPEMRFGVNCYGVKPSQTANDVRLLEEKGILPQSPDTLKINQQAQEYKEKLGSIGVMPFSDAKWSEY
jgi:hypothetical protein